MTMMPLQQLSRWALPDALCARRGYACRCSSRISRHFWAFFFAPFGVRINVVALSATS